MAAQARAMSINPGAYNLSIYQNATYAMTFIWYTGGCPCGTVGSTPSPVNITGYTATLQIRPYALSTTVLFDASSDITLGGAAGTIALLIPATSTATFTWWTGVYDLLLTDTSGNVTALLEGTVTVTPGVST
jgi:hypothetical protein